MTKIGSIIFIVSIIGIIIMLIIPLFNEEKCADPAGDGNPFPPFDIRDAEYLIALILLTASAVTGFLMAMAGVTTDILKYFNP